MKKNEFEAMDAKALAGKIEEMRREYFQMKENLMAGSVNNTTALRLARRNIARAKTQLVALKNAKEVK